MREIEANRVADEVTGTRRVALEVLTAVRAGEFADRALARVGDQLDSRDHAWVQELVYGTFRLRGRLDHILEGYVRSGLGALDPVVHDVLRLGTYQLLEMGGVPAYAAVSQSVELARAAGAGRAAGLVNGVLQSVRRGKDRIEFPSLESDPVGHLATWGSHPRWLVERWVSRWGAADAKALVEVNNRRPDLFLRPVGLDADDAVARLSNAGIDAEIVAGFPDSVRVVSGGGPREALAIVPGVVQDPAAAMVVRFADISEGSTVIDLSAAPGGKTVGLAERAGYVVAADLSVGRLRRVRSNAERAGVIDRVGLVVGDGRFPPFRATDAVLIDAPCAGTGTLRRHPDGRWRITEADIEALTALQRELLIAAVPLVRPGGLLIYSTCSVEPEENEEQIERFLEEHDDFRLLPPPAGLDDTMISEGYLALLPQRQGVDGAFAARLERME